jgi:hypothetical protein
MGGKHEDRSDDPSLAALAADFGLGLLSVAYSALRRLRDATDSGIRPEGQCDRDSSRPAVPEASAVLARQTGSSVSGREATVGEDKVAVKPFYAARDYLHAHKLTDDELKEQCTRRLMDVRRYRDTEDRINAEMCEQRIDDLLDEISWRVHNGSKSFVRG